MVARAGDTVTPTRLLVLTTSWPRSPEDPAGAFVSELNTELGRHGFVTRTVALRPPKGGALQAYEDGRWARLAAATCRMAIESLGPADAVLSHWMLPSGIIGGLLGRPHVSVAHGGDLRLLERRPKLTRWLADRTDGVVSVTRAGAAQVRARRTLIQPMGIEALGPPMPMPAPPLRVLFLGRLVRLKGLRVLMEAARAVPDALFTVAGDGPERGLEGRAPGNLRFVGAVPLSARADLIAAHHVLCVPSIGREGAPRVVAEAHSLGRPVLASRIGGLPELLGDAWLVPPGDPGALAGRLLLLAARPPTQPSPLPSGAGSAWSVVGARVARFLRQCWPGLAPSGKIGGLRAGGPVASDRMKHDLNNPETTTVDGGWTR